MRRQAGRVLIAYAFASPLIGCFAFGWDIVQRPGGADPGDSAVTMDSGTDAGDSDHENDGGGIDSAATSDLDASLGDAGSQDARTDGRAADAGVLDASSDASSFDASDGSGEAGAVGASRDGGDSGEAGRADASVSACVGQASCAPTCPAGGSQCLLSCENVTTCTPTCPVGGNCLIECRKTGSCNRNRPDLGAGARGSVGG